MTPEQIRALEQRLFLDAICLRYGYDLRGYMAASMTRRVQHALDRVGSPHLGDLMHRVLTDPELFARVLHDLTVPVSDVFRDPEIYEAMRRTVVPHLETYAAIKVWHAGCATGEEAYSSAIFLEESGLLERSQIYATDMSVIALDQARGGVYSRDRFEAFRENYRRAGGTRAFEDYCTLAYDAFIMSNHLRDHVLFFHHNLVSDYAPGEMHLVFCRNVLIYFEADLRTRVLSLLTDAVRPGGFLCLGTSEVLGDTEAAAGFEPFDRANRIYRRREQP